MENKKQIIFIRGGEAFDQEGDFYEYLKNREYNPFQKQKNWRDWVEWALSEKYEMMAPVMPCKQNADYQAWKIWFEKLFAYLNNEDLIVIGQSLGTTFIMKYLIEEKFPKPIKQLHFVSPVISSEGLVGEGIGNFVFDQNKFYNLEQQVDKIFIYTSTNDPLVPIVQAQEVYKKLPKAKFFEFKNRGHFNQPSFPELLENINKNLE